MGNFLNRFSLVLTNDAALLDTLFLDTSYMRIYDMAWIASSIRWGCIYSAATIAAVAILSRPPSRKHAASYIVLASYAGFAVGASASVVVRMVPPSFATIPMLPLGLAAIASVVLDAVHCKSPLRFLCT